MHRKLIHLSLLASIGTILFVLEEWVSPPIPIFKIGIANAVTLLVLLWYGWKEALLVVFIRVCAGTLWVGTFLSPGFYFSLSGGIGSTLAMAIGLQLYPKGFSLIGVSILGAWIKNAVQIGLAWLLYVHHLQIWSILPWFFLVSLFGGIIVGIIVTLVWEKWILSNHPRIASK